MRVTGLRLRGILDSRGEVTYEAELSLEGGYAGRGSCPRAIAPGRLERELRPAPRLGPVPDGPVGERISKALLGRAVGDQDALDDLLAALDRDEAVGAAVTLAVSLAYARAAAAAAGRSLHEYVARLAGTEPSLPRLLVNVFSGGIHVDRAATGYQQIMVIPRTGDLAGDIEVAGAVWSRAAALAQSRFDTASLSASSGLLVPASSVEQLDLLRLAIDRAGYPGVASIGIDVAAEHLMTEDGRYRLGTGLLAAEELLEVLAEQTAGYGLTYLEDPFDPAHEAAWRALRHRLPATVQVIGDDLFATDARRVDPALADGILLKLSQAGTLTATLRAAASARASGMLLAVSHRSGETEDTAMCDLAVGLGAELIKVGGPRRGDRLAKYNQLLRLAESVPAVVLVP